MATPDKVLSLLKAIKPNNVASMAVKTPTTGIKKDNPASTTAIMLNAFIFNSLYI